VPEMEACWPSSVVLRGRALNRPVLRWLKTVVVSDRGEGALDASGGTGKTFQKAPGLGCPGVACAVEASLAQVRWHRSGGSGCSPVMSLAGSRLLARWCPA